MTIAGLVLSTILTVGLFGVFKFILFGLLAQTSIAIAVVFWIILVAITTAIVRRLGTLNYAEAILLAVVWLLFSVIFDAVLTTRLVGGGLLLNWNYWTTQAVITVSILLFHKKIHTKIDLSKYG